MSATVQATCPGCRNVLRIPVDWADKPLRCKKCGVVLQAKKKPVADTATAPPVARTTEAPALPANPAYVAIPVAAPPAPFADDDFPGADRPARRRRYRRGSGGSRWVGLGIVVVICGALVGGGVYLSKTLAPNGKKAGPPAGAADPTGPPAADPGSPAALTADPFPRRLLFVHVANYVYFNSLSAGSSGGKDMPTRSAEKLAFELRVPTHPDHNQLFVLSDTAGGKDFHPPVKPVLTGAYTRFFETSRPQDRVVVYFGGHAVAADGKAYLVPVEGEPEVVGSFVPLEDFYAKLAACPAQQKVVLFDVCRLDPDRGEGKPGGGPLTEELAKLLLAAPPGVKVAIGCSPGQNAQESHDTGSEFLTAFRVVTERARRAGKVVPPKPEDPIPAAELLDRMRAYLGEPRGKVAPQAVQVGGTDPASQVAYSKDEPPAKRFDWPAAPKGVPADQVVKLLRQVNLPGIRADLSVPADLPRVYPFTEAAMKGYADDGVTDEQILKAGDKYPVRKAALEALGKIAAAWRVGSGADAQVGLMEEFEGAVDDQLRKRIQDQQVPVAKIDLELKEAIALLEAAAKDLDKEKSKRWRAVFQYARAQALLRSVFIEEYNGALGKIKTDSLPRDPNNMGAGLRLVATSKIGKKEVREKAEAARELLDGIAAEHQGTPYEVIAKLHKHISVGLEWRAISKKGKKDEDAK